MTEDPQQSKKIVFDDYQVSAFGIFLEFFSNLNCFNDFKELRKKYDWRQSLTMKINAVSILSNEVKIQYDKAMMAKEEMEKKGFGSGLESTLLLIRFETMLNSIYSLCDNLAFVGQRLHPGIKRSFNDQRKNIQKSKTLYPEYAEYLELIEGSDWYQMLHTMRSESTHYLPGFVFHSKSGLGILYQNMEHSEEKIEIENIQEYVGSLIMEINKFLENYGKYHLKKFIKEDHTTFHPCLIPHQSGKGFLAGGRMISLSEYLKKEPGKCIKNFECPNRENCPAYEKNVD